MNALTQQTPNIPAIRFSEFGGVWKVKNLGELLTITSASRVHKDEWTKEGVPFFRSSDIVAAFKGVNNNKAFISHELFERLSQKSGRVEKLDLLVTGGGSIGIPYLVKSNDPLYFKDADLLWFKNVEQLNSYFLYNFLLTQIFKKFLERISHIGTIAHYTVQQAKATPIKFPLLQEQKKIAAFLGAVDEKITQLTRKKDLLTQYKKSTMQKLFSQKIRFEDDNGNNFPDWEEKRLEDIASFLKGKGVSKSDISENGQYECIRYGQLYTDYAETIDVIVSRTNVSPNGMVLSEANDVIIPASGETQIDIATASCVLRSNIILGGDLNIIRSKENGVFLSYYLNSKLKYDIARLAQGISVVHLYSSQLKTLKLQIPQKLEQQKIADFLSVIDAKIDLTTQEITHAKAFKKGLLQQMFV